MRSLGMGNWLRVIAIAGVVLAGNGCKKEEQKQAPAVAAAPAPPTAPAPGAQEGLTVAVQDAAASADGTAKVCVRLENNSGNVSGMQMDLKWDPACLRAGESAAEPKCTMNPAAQRAMFRAVVRNPGSLRVVFLNLTDTTPMPASVGELFCCEFRVAEGSSGRKCSVDVTNAIASDPKGVRLPIGVRGGSVEAKSSAQG